MAIKADELHGWRYIEVLTDVLTSNVEIQMFLEEGMGNEVVASTLVLTYKNQ